MITQLQSNTIQVQPPPELSLPLSSFFKSSQLRPQSGRLTSELDEETDMAKMVARGSLDCRAWTEVLERIIKGIDGDGSRTLFQHKTVFLSEVRIPDSHLTPPIIIQTYKNISQVWIKWRVPNIGASRMTQLINMPAIKPNNLRLVLRTHMVGENWLLLVLWLPHTLRGTYMPTYIQTKINKMQKKKFSDVGEHNSTHLLFYTQEAKTAGWWVWGQSGLPSGTHLNNNQSINK